MSEAVLPETVTPAELLSGDIIGAVRVGQEKTLLESSQILFHHRKDECAGDCCLHGTSVYSSCHYPRAWITGVPGRAGHLVHECGHAKRHPCAAGIAYADKAFGGPLDMEHDCCGDPGCCSWLEAEFVAKEFDPLDEEAEGVETLEDVVDGLTEWADTVTQILEKLAVGSKRRGNQVDRLWLDLSRVENMFVGSERTALGAAAAVGDLKIALAQLRAETDKRLRRMWLFVGAGSLIFLVIGYLLAFLRDVPK